MFGWHNLGVDSGFFESRSIFLFLFWNTSYTALAILVFNLEIPHIFWRNGFGSSCVRLGCFSLASSWRRKIEKGKRPCGTSTTERPPRQQLHLLFSLTAFLAARYLMLLPSLFSIGECPCVATGTYNITVTYVLYVPVATYGHSPSK